MIGMRKGREGQTNWKMSQHLSDRLDTQTLESIQKTAVMF